jgi:hypothetical protein
LMLGSLQQLGLSSSSVTDDTRYGAQWVRKTQKTKKETKLLIEVCIITDL